MACNDDFRHVCYKDLENYVKRDQYFADFNPEEIALIQKNLGIDTTDKDDENKYAPTLIIGDYNSIYQEVVLSKLKVGYIYVIRDFRSVYLDRDGKICGLDYMPSQEYWLFLTPNSSNTFDKRVKLYQPTGTILSSCANWIVEYDITPTVLDNMTTSRGTITYLKDANNNTAYYDFKNIKFKKTLSELSKGPTTYEFDTYLYTFDNGGNDSSETFCKNNHLEKGANRNVFLGNTQNVTLAADCHDNIFFRNCENCVFDYGTYGNFFQDNVVRCKGTVHEKQLGSITSSNYPKQFDVLNDKEVMVYLDSQTQTYQIKQL